MNRNIFTFFCFLLFSNIAVYGQKTYQKKKSYVYEVTWSDVKNNYSFNDLIILKRVRGWANGGQKKITWMTYPNVCVNKEITDSLFMFFQDTTCLAQCEKNWDKLNKGIMVGTTGVIESKEWVWIHPPRIKYYKILEFAPFPIVYFDTVNHKSSLTLKSGWGVHEGVTVKSSYSFTKKTETTFEISARSDSSLGGSTLRAVFEKGVGFTKMTYLIFDTYCIDFVLQ